MIQYHLSLCWKPSNLVKFETMVILNLLSQYPDCDILVVRGIAQCCTVKSAVQGHGPFIQSCLCLPCVVT